MSRCARCGHSQEAHGPYAINAPHTYRARTWHPFTPRDPWWIRTLARLGRRR